MIKEKRKEIVIIRRNFLLRESTEITVITIILISIVLRTGKIIIMLLGGGYTELLWIIMGITGISVRTWIIMGIMGISVRKMIIGNRPGRLEYNQKTLRLRKRIKRYKIK